MDKQRLKTLAGIVTEMDDPGPWTHEGGDEEVLHQVRRDLTKLSSRLAQLAGRQNIRPELRDVAKQAEGLLDQARHLIYDKV